MKGEPQFVESLRVVLSLVVVTLTLLVTTAGYFFFKIFQDELALQPPVPLVQNQKLVQNQEAETDIWQAPDSTLIPLTPHGDLIRYGRELIAHTASYLGPEGKVKRISNGMNCQSCHLKAGTKPFGNNYAAVASTYPKYRARSGTIESIEKRINDCIERSLNGQKLEENSVEIRAIISYFQWVGKDVKKGVVPRGAGIIDLPLMERPSDPVKGKFVFAKHCALCHGPEGLGFKHKDSLEWKYPPLAGVNSYSVGAGLYRISRLAGYVKTNMPHGTYYDNPVLSDEEAWDVAAYINSLPRPSKDISSDWPDIASKPFDHPFGPYADGFSETQHKYGPFDQIQQVRKGKK